MDKEKGQKRGEACVRSDYLVSGYTPFDTHARDDGECELRLRGRHLKLSRWTLSEN